jgi:hypothetical protein
MRLLHDALGVCHPLLPEPLRSECAGLFDEPEHLGNLAERLLRFARQGVPDQQPPPHFSAECTPPLLEAFAPFREPIAAWHDAPDSPEVPALLAGAVVEAKCPGLLVLLGQRRTPASLLDARGIPPTRAKLLSTAERVHTPGDSLTVAGRALTKHAPRSQEAFWGEVTGSVAQKNAAARRLLETILAGATWWNVFGHFQHEVVYEARLPSGHGARWGQAGETFIGFLEPFDETRGALGERDSEITREGAEERES